MAKLGLDKDELVARFTDRKYVIEAFSEGLKKGSPVSIFHFYGLGGTGKTFLLHYLRYKFIDPGHSQDSVHPNSILCFRPGSASSNARSTLWEVVTQLKNEADRCGFKAEFNRFDFIWYKIREREFAISEKEKCKLVPDTISWVPGVIEKLGQVPLLGTVPAFANACMEVGVDIKEQSRRKGVMDWFYIYFSKRYNTDLESAIRSMEVPKLEGILPKALAADLRDLGENLPGWSSRIVLFFDGLERFQRHVSDHYDVDKIDFLQSLAEEIVLSNSNVLLVLAGQNILRWGYTQRNNGDWVPIENSIWCPDIDHSTSHLKQIPLLDFPPLDSLHYLEQVRGIPEAQAKVIHQFTSDYPLALSIAADILHGSNTVIDDWEMNSLVSRLRGFEPYSKEWRYEIVGWLLEKLFSNLTEKGHVTLKGLLRAAAIPHWFNLELLACLCKTYDIQDAYHLLLSFSFVEPEQKFRFVGNATNYRLHPTLRNLLNSSSDGRVNFQEWNQLAIAYFETQMDTYPKDSRERWVMRLESVYHQICLNRRKGLETIENLFFLEFKFKHLENCDKILEVLSEFHDWEEKELSKIGELKGRLNLALHRYELAIRQFSDALAPIRNDPEKITSCVTIGYFLAEAKRLKGDYPEALAIFKELRAIDSKNSDHQEAIQFLASWGESRTHKLLDDPPLALELCEVAERALSRLGQGGSLIVELTSNPIDKSFISANLHRHKSEIFRYLSNYAEAFACIEHAIKIYLQAAVSAEHHYSNLVMAHILRMEGRYIEAFDHANQALDGFQGLKDLRGELTANRALGQTAYAAGDFSVSRGCFEILASSSKEVYPYGPIYGHLGLGELERLAGNTAQAKTHYKIADNLCKGLGGIVESAYAILGLAEVERAAGRNAEAFLLSQSAVEIGEKCQYPWILAHGNLVASLTTGAGDATLYQELASINVRKMKSRFSTNPTNTLLLEAFEAIQAGNTYGPICFNFL